MNCVVVFKVIDKWGGICGAASPSNDLFFTHSHVVRVLIIPRRHAAICTRCIALLDPLTGSQGRFSLT